MGKACAPLNRAAQPGWAPRDGLGWDRRMRVMFFGWLLLIATGLVYFSVIGLTHH
jgi:hypothetical protein